MCCSCVGVPAKPLPLTGQETGIDVGLKGVRITAEGEAVDTPRHCRKAERELKKAQRRVSRRTEGSTRRRKAVQLLARKHRKVRRQRHDFHHKTALTLVRRYEAIYYEAIYYEAIYYEAIYYEAIYLEDLPVSNLSRRPKAKPAALAALSTTEPVQKLASTRRFKTLGGRASARSALARQPAPGREWKPYHQRLHPRTVAGVGDGWRKASPCAPRSAHPVGWCWTATKTRPRTSNGPGRPFGESQQWLGRRTENPSGFSPCGVSELLAVGTCRWRACGRQWIGGSI